MLRQLILNSRLNFRRRLFPQNCLLCCAEAGDATLCASCLADLPLLATPGCPICAHPNSVQTQGEICGACLRQPPAFLRCIAAYTYHFPVDKLITALKYNHQFAVIDTLTAPLIARLSTETLPDALIAMPLHPQRLRERGFNQSLLLARHMARRLQLPLLQTACQRVRHTSPQTTLAIEQRRLNMRNAFSCNQTVANKRIAIIDDVMTTGSSLDSLSRVLLRVGATEVQCWVSARAVLS